MHCRVEYDYKYGYNKERYPSIPINKPTTEVDQSKRSRTPTKVFGDHKLLLDVNLASLSPSER